MSAKESVPSAKIVFLGAPAVGAKTCLLHRYLKREFDEKLPSTLGAAFFCKLVEVEGIKMKLVIWGLLPVALFKEHTIPSRHICTHRHSRTGTIPLACTIVLSGCEGSNRGL